VLAGHEPHVSHELARVVEAEEVLQLGDQGHSGDQLYAAQCLQRLDEWSQAPVGQRVAHGLLQPADPGAGFGDRMQVLLEADLLGRVLELDGSEPAQVRSRPGALAGVRGAVAQKECLEAVAAIALLAHGVVPGAHQVADRFVGAVGNAYDCQVIGTRQACQLHGVTAIGLDALTARVRYRRGRHDVTAPAQGREVALQHKAAWTGFVDDVQSVTGAHEPAHRLAHCGHTAGNAS
jgi:hypothetical protein